MSVIAIIPAAGIGSRMKSEVAKPYLHLAGKPILAHTLEVFERTPEVHQVAVVVRSSELETCQEQVIAPYQFKKVFRLIPGGKERQDSVYQGLKALRQEDDLEIIVVHDGVRPLISPEQVRRVIQAARRHGGAILGVPAQDTLKRIDARGKVLETLDRRQIWSIQTPQAFQAHLLWRAFVEAYCRNFCGTDEASLLEELRQPVMVIPGSALNLKITTQEDLLMAEALLPIFQGSGIGS